MEILAEETIKSEVLHHLSALMAEIISLFVSGIVPIRILRRLAI